MLIEELQANWNTFSMLIHQLRDNVNMQNTGLVQRHIEQNILILNELFAISISHLEKLQSASTQNEFVCMQAEFTKAISTQLSLSAQQLINTSLGQIANYNDWLKAHCDLATD